MDKRILPALLVLAGGLGLFALPARGQPAPQAAGTDDTVIISGTVTAVEDTDDDKKNDTFTINTGGENTKKVFNKEETKDMGLIKKDDHVEIKVKVTDDGNQIVDVIKIGK